jgi:hypothetical protein
VLASVLWLACADARGAMKPEDVKAWFLSTPERKEAVDLILRDPVAYRAKLVRGMASQDWPRFFPTGEKRDAAIDEVVALEGALCSEIIRGQKADLALARKVLDDSSLHPTLRFRGALLLYLQTGDFQYMAKALVMDPPHVRLFWQLKDPAFEPFVRDMIIESAREQASLELSGGGKAPASRFINGSYSNLIAALAFQKANIALRDNLYARMKYFRSFPHPIVANVMILRLMPIAKSQVVGLLGAIVTNGSTKEIPPVVKQHPELHDEIVGVLESRIEALGQSQEDLKQMLDALKDTHGGNAATTRPNQ